MKQVLTFEDVVPNENEYGIKISHWSKVIVFFFCVRMKGEFFMRKENFIRQYIGHFVRLPFETLFREFSDSAFKKVLI